MSPPSLFTRLCANRRPLSWLVALWTPPPDAGTVPLPGGGGTCLAAGKWATFAPGATGAACRSRPTQRVSKRGPHPGAQALAPTRHICTGRLLLGAGGLVGSPFFAPLHTPPCGGEGFCQGAHPPHDGWPGRWTLVTTVVVIEQCRSATDASLATRGRGASLSQPPRVRARPHCVARAIIPTCTWAAPCRIAGETAGAGRRGGGWHATRGGDMVPVRLCSAARPSSSRRRRRRRAGQLPRPGAVTAGGGVPTPSLKSPSRRSAVPRGRRASRPLVGRRRAQRAGTDRRGDGWVAVAAPRGPAGQRGDHLHPQQRTGRVAHQPFHCRENPGTNTRESARRQEQWQQKEKKRKATTNTKPIRRRASQNNAQRRLHAQRRPPGRLPARPSARRPPT